MQRMHGSRNAAEIFGMPAGEERDHISRLTALIDGRLSAG